MGKSVVIQRIPEIKRVLELYNEGGPEEVVKSIQGISDWISSDLESSYSLDYLEKYEFKENPILNNLYATVLEYQEQKKSRDEKEEHQFLIAILIGRKIKAIAQLHDESVISSHLNHLKDFMGKICAEEFLTTAPVFKMVLLQFKGNLEGKTDIEKSHSSKFEALSKNIQDEVNKLLEVIKSELLALTSPFEYPENFFLVSDPENDLLQNVEAITKSPLYLSLKHIPEQYKFGLLIAVKNREDLNDVSEKFIVLLKEISLLKERFHKHKPEGINTAFFKRYNQISEFLESKFSVCLSCFVGELLSKPDKIEECFEAAKKQLEDSITAYIEPLEKEKVAAANPMPSKEQIGSMIY
jgi:hypothetical protein